MTNKFASITSARSLLVLALAGTTLGACSDDPVSYSAPVGISLKVASGDVVAGQLAAEKNINTESGNPYGAFIADARDALGGSDPQRIELTGASLTLESSSTNVATLGEVFTGATSIAFQLNSTDTIVPVGSIGLVAISGAGPLAIDVDFDIADLATEDFDGIVGGSFKVQLSGPAAAGFEAASADADLTATFTFEAFDE